MVIGLPDKDLFNASEPKDDAQFATYVTHPTLPALIDVLFREPLGAADNVAPSNLPRTDLVSAFLTGFEGVNQLATVTPSEMLRLNTAIPATAKEGQASLGVAAGDLAGFPNGRRPGGRHHRHRAARGDGGRCVTRSGSIWTRAARPGRRGDNLGLCAPLGRPARHPRRSATAWRRTPRSSTTPSPYLTTPIPGSPLSPDGGAPTPPANPGSGGGG